MCVGAVCSHVCGDQKVMLVFPQSLSYFTYFFKKIYAFCFMCVSLLPAMCVCAMFLCLISAVVRRGCQIFGTVVTDVSSHVGTGNQAHVLCKNNKCC